VKYTEVRKSFLNGTSAAIHCQEKLDNNKIKQVLNVIQQKAASPTHLDDLIAFARWRPCNPSTCFLSSTWIHTSNGIWIGSAIFAQLMANGRLLYNGPPLSRSTLPLHMGVLESGSPSNTCFLGPIPISILISSTVSAQLMAEYPHTLQWATPSPQNYLFAYGIWIPSNAWFLRPTQLHNPNGMSIGSAIFAGLTIVTDRQADHTTPSVAIGDIYVCSNVKQPDNN